MEVWWATQKLGTASDIIMGQAPPGKTYNKDGTGTAFVRAGEFGPKRPIIRVWTTAPLKMSKRTDVLLCVVGATCGKINLGEECAIGRSVAAIRPDRERLDQLFLHFYLQGKVLQMRSASQGAAQTVISKSMIANFGLPLPPLPEQERIVAILDEAFAAIDTATANTEKNLANAKELFESQLVKAFTGNGVMDGWEQATLGEVCGLQNGFVFKSKSFKTTGVPVLRISNISEDAVSNNRQVFVNPKDYEEDLSRYIVSEGDLVIAMSGATTGKVGFNHAGHTFLLNQRVGKFEPSSSLNINYLFYYLKTKVDENLTKAAGAAQPNLSTKQIKELQLVLPPLPDQERIVAMLDETSETRDSLQSQYQQKNDSLSQLKQSLLQKAFTGELTADAKVVDRALSEASI
jgi:type I restriction enzyme, S subunit